MKRQRNISIKPKIQKLQLDVTLSKIPDSFSAVDFGQEDREMSEDPQSYIFESFTFFLKPFESIKTKKQYSRPNVKCCTEGGVALCRVLHFNV